MAFWNRDGKDGGEKQEPASSKGSSTDYEQLLSGARAEAAAEGPKVEVPRVPGNPETQRVLDGFAEAGQGIVDLLREMRGGAYASEAVARVGEALAQIVEGLPRGSSTETMERAAGFARDIVRAIGSVAEGPRGRVIKPGSIPSDSRSVFTESSSTKPERPDGMDSTYQRWGLNGAINFIRSVTGEREDVKSQPREASMPGPIDWKRLDPQHPSSDQEIPLGIGTALVMRATRIYSPNGIGHEDIYGGDVISTKSEAERAEQRERAERLNKPSDVDVI